MHWEWGKVVKTINWTFIANLVNFALLLYLMKRFLFKPALDYLDKRRERIAARIQAAREGEEKAAQLVAEREEELKTAHAQEIIAAAKEDAKAEANRILAEARRQTEQERSRMEAELRRAYAEIAVLGAARVLDREVKVKDHRHLLDQLLAEIDEQALKAK